VKYTFWNLNRLARYRLTAAHHPGIQFLGIGEDGALIAAKTANRQAKFSMPSLDSSATAAKMPGNGLP
jgi:diaminopimelate epimerase